MKHLALLLTLLIATLAPAWGRNRSHSGHSGSSSKSGKSTHKPVYVHSSTRRSGKTVKAHDRALPGRRKGRSHHQGGK
jgi:hypothetical protein